MNKFTLDSCQGNNETKQYLERMTRELDIENIFKEVQEQMDWWLARRNYNVIYSMTVSKEYIGIFDLSITWGDLQANTFSEMWLNEGYTIQTAIDNFHGLCKELDALLMDKQNRYAASLVDLPQS
jgi:hypothetical protein